MKPPSDYQNLNKIASSSGREVSTWVKQNPGKAQIAAFSESHPEIESPIITKRGKGGGTYAHPALAAIFAVWCNPSLPADHHELIKMAAEKISELTSKLPQPAPGITVMQLNGFTLEHDELLGMTSLSAIANEHNVDLNKWLKRGYKTAASKVMALLDLDLHFLVRCKEDGTAWAHPMIAIAFGKWISKECGEWCETNLPQLMITGRNTKLRDPNEPKPDWDTPDLDPEVREQMYAQRHEERVQLSRNIQSLCEQGIFAPLPKTSESDPEFAQFVKEQNEIARYFVRNDIKIIPPQSKAQLLEMARADRLALSPAN
jgi:KilA-N domain